MLPLSLSLTCALSALFFIPVNISMHSELSILQYGQFFLFVETETPQDVQLNIMLIVYP